MAEAYQEADVRVAYSIGKQATAIPLPPRIGNCISCGQHIRLTGSATTCPTCTAWRRWYVAHRIASRYLREVTR